MAPESGCLRSCPDAHTAGLRTTLGELLMWNNVSQNVATNQDHLGMQWDLPLEHHHGSP